ncbi:hypothetical protein ACP70R_015354 [Stipagrostis hirtigluma subsp. patula]
MKKTSEAFSRYKGHIRSIPVADYFFISAFQIWSSLLLSFTSPYPKISFYKVL